MAAIVEIMPSSTWVDITGKIRYESGLSIERGRSSESDLTSSQCTFVLDNRDSQFSSDVPGTAYYRTLGRGTPIRVREKVITDSFTRTSNNSWGSSEFPGTAWQTAGGSASDYSVTSGVGRHTLSTANASRLTFVPLKMRDVMVSGTITIGALTTGAAANAGFLARRTPNGAAHYRAELRFATSGAVTAALVRLGGPFTTDLDTQVLTDTYTAASTFNVILLCVGTKQYMKAWLAGTDEPNAWTCEGTDKHLRAGNSGFRSTREASNSNSNLTFDVDNFLVSDPRFYGEVWSLRPMADLSGNDRTMTVEASGIFRRLSNTRKIVRSSLFRTLSTGSGVTTPTAAPVAYWPLEDGSMATELEAFGASARVGYLGGTDVNLAADNDVPGSAALPNLGTGGFLAGQILDAGIDPVTDEWSVSWLCRIDEIPDEETVIARIPTSGEETAGYEVAMDTGGDLILRALSSHNLALDLFEFEVSNEYDTGRLDNGDPTIFGRWVIMTMFTEITGGPNYRLRLSWTDATGDYTTTTVSSSASGTVMYQPQGNWTFHGPPSGSRGFGHLAVWDGNVALTWEQATGWAGELAVDRVERLCTEEGIAFEAAGAGSEYMGPQPIGSLLDALEDVGTADHGILCEPRHQLGVKYRARTTLYNQIPYVEIDIDASELHGGLEPVRDDSSGLANAVTATRPSGTAQVYVIPDGDPIHLTTQDPPDGIGVVEASISPNVEEDIHAAAQAAWAAHTRSWREPRYEEITVMLHGPAYSSNPSLTAAVAGLDLGDVFQLVNQPEWIPPEPIELMVQGVREYVTAKTDSSGNLTQVERTLTFNTTPAVAWEVWAVDTSGSTIVTAEDSDETNFKVATSSGPEWKTSPDPPFLIRTTAGGEAMVVTGVTTETPSFTAAGTVSTANNASVTPGLPAGMTADAGHLMLLFACIRNSGTGTVNTPSGWTLLSPGGTNFEVYGRYYVTGDSAPTVSFTGGAANADTIGRIIAFTNTSMHVDYSVQTQLNGSAQNIAYPALALRSVNSAGVRRDNLLAIIAGWKQDDWTSVATLSGRTEAFENSTTTGDDAGLVVDYDIWTTAEAISAGSFTVTGGASAISRSIVMALRPLQSFTVERSVNGVVGSITAGDTIHVYRHGQVPL